MRALITYSHIPDEARKNPHNAFVGEFAMSHHLVHGFLFEAFDVKSIPVELLKGLPASSFLEGRGGGIQSSFREFKTIHMKETGWINLVYYPRGGVGYLMVQGFYTCIEDATLALSKIQGIIPENEPAEGIVPVHFWNWSERSGPTQTVRHIAAPSWTSIRPNYRANVKVALDATNALDVGTLSGGRVLLWGGEPGTGKTWALRALLREWKNWCVPHYIVDPDAFFSKAEYLISVVSQVSVSESNDVPSGQSIGRPRSSRPQHNWNLLILEDTGELIAKDAKQRTGQALSKLLNLGDGLLGQGLNLLTMITTNEDHGDLHPAITRQGRCISNVTFGALESEDAIAWLRAKGCDTTPSGRQKLSDLYALVGETGTIRNATERIPAGFVNGAS